MYTIRLLLGLAGILVLSSCMMMGGMGNMGHMGAMDHTANVDSGQPQVALHHAEASNGDLTIALSFSAPSGGASIPIDARLNTGSDHHELTRADVWLRIQRPGGAIDEIPMRAVHSSDAGTYRAQYSFRTAGLHVVTAEGRLGTGNDARMASVSIEVEISSEVHHGQHGLLSPAALAGSLSMAVMMVLMMGV